MKTIVKLAVFISGSGTNLQAIIDVVKQGIINVELTVVVSDIDDAYGLQRAKQAGIETLVLEPEQFTSKKEFEKVLLENLKEKEIELVALAGFMRLLSSYFIQNFPGEIINIHPSLLPSFPGLHAQRQAIEHGVKISGCTVHFVDEGMDTGPIILQAAVEVEDGDDEETLAARILEQEHRIYPKAIKLLVEGRLKREGRKVVIK